MTGIPAAVALGINDEAVTKACGLVVSITGDVLKGREQQRAKYPYALWSDVEVTVNGVTKTFTYEEFFSALGFDSVAGPRHAGSTASGSESPTQEAL